MADFDSEFTEAMVRKLRDQPTMAELLQGVIVEARSWRNFTFADVPRGYPVFTYRQHQERHPRDKHLVEAIDNFDILTGYPETKESIVLRAREAIDRINNSGELTDEERIKVLKWLNNKDNDDNAARPDDQHAAGDAAVDAEEHAV